MIKALNLYAGVGGNRKLWTDCDVTAVENNEQIAAIYQKLNPQDTVVVGDAHEYLRVNYRKFDFIWSSPPCQTHSRMAIATKHTNHKYPSMSLYEEILFLRTFYKGMWVVENVQPFYEPLIRPDSTVGRHVFWSNILFYIEDIKSPDGFINLGTMAGKKVLMDWLGIYFEENIYYDGNHCPTQILRNCVHPKIGLQIFEAVAK
jgi:DNA (cytosine-5)-methyltransferase 1